MNIKTAKITSKGQATIPKYIRELLKTNVVEFEVVDGNVVIRPVKSIGASLGRYAKGRIPLAAAREKVWEGRARERSGKTS